MKEERGSWDPRRLMGESDSAEVDAHPLGLGPLEAPFS